MEINPMQAILRETVQKLTQQGKGILAADESPGSMFKKFDPINVENTPENRKRYRSILFGTNDLEKYISGVILHEETLGQRYNEAKTIPEQINSKNIVVGIKVDKGLKPLFPSCPSNPEKFTNGLDSLNELCKRSFKLGARFAKWRCALVEGTDMPCQLAIDETARTLARYAEVCQANGLVPIVEPELLSVGSRTLERNRSVSRKIFAKTMQLLSDYKIDLRGCLLKPHMVTPGLDSLASWDSGAIGQATVETLSETCPSNLGGVFFLSGGQDEHTATRNLLAINKYKQEKGTLPFTLSFSFGRALQNNAIKTWKGDDKNAEQAQNVLLETAKSNWSAVNAVKYLPKLPKSLDPTAVDNEVHDY